MTDLEPVVSLGSSQRGWAAELTRFISDHGGARLRGTIITAVDAVDQDYEVLIVDDIASYLTPRFIDRVQRLHRRVIGVYDPESGESGRTRLTDLGVDAILEADADPDEFLEVVASLRGVQAFGESPIGIPVPIRMPEDPQLDSVTAVIGGDGAVELALGLADHSASNGAATVLADLDTLNPSLAQRLNLALVPNLLTALDSHTQLRGTVEESLIPSLRGYLILLGLPEAQEWDTVQAQDVLDLMDEIAAGADQVIVKLDPQLEDLAGLSTRQGRFEVARAMIARATQVVVTAEATPIGLARTLGWVARARNLSDAPIHVAFEGAPSSLFQRGELSEELVRSFIPASISWLPNDGRVLKASWNGEVVAPGPYTKAVGGLAKKMARMTQMAIA